MAITLPVLFPITGTIQGTFLILSIPCVVATIMWWALVREAPPVISYENPDQNNRIPVSHVLKDKTLWLIAIFFFITSFFFHNWIAWAPELMMEKGASADTASLISSSLLWVAIPSVLLAPRFAHRMGLRKPFLLIPSIALALAPLWAIYMTAPMGWPLMIMVGIFDSVRTIMVLALPLELMPKEAVGTASGLIVSIGFSGGVVGPMVGGLILDLTGNLDMSLIVLLAISIAAIAIAYKIPETGYRNG
jgi:CP family cyanate transporter-like MFS transporter